MVYVVKREGREVARLSGAQIVFSSATRAVFTMRDADGKLIGSFFLTSEKGWTIEPLLLDGASIEGVHA